MPYTHNGKEYRSKKFPMLEHIFNKRTENGTKGIGDNHTFTLRDVSEGYAACGIREPASISNTILDLTRQDRGIQARLPVSIIELGYDLRKKTGDASNGDSYAGEFVFVGLGNALSSWHLWNETPDKTVVIQNKISPKIARYLSNDEGALFSAIDYCDVLSKALYDLDNVVTHVQNPMKWHPNEIDGLYFSDFEGHDTLYPIEAKALSTGDQINLEQMLGGYRTIKEKIPRVQIIPLGIQMIVNGMRIGVFRENNGQIEIVQYLQVTFNPPIRSFQRTPVRQKDAYMESLFSDTEL